MSTPQGEQGGWTLRMRDVCREAGVTRQVVHFYIQQGLLPPGRKTGRNMAYYGQVHIERIQQIRRLQHERFLPLRVIKSLLTSQEADYSDEQRQFLREVRRTVQVPSLENKVSVDQVLAEHAVLSEDEVERLVEIGLIGAATGPDGEAMVSQAAAELLGTLARFREIGFTEEAGFAVEDLAIFDEAITGLIRQEASVFVRTLNTQSPERAALMVREVLPVINTLLVRLHQTRIDDLLSAL